MGSVLAYFYEVDGSLMLGFGLVLFCAYFHTYAQLSNREKWKHTVLLLLFGGSIFLSLVFKQLIGFFTLIPTRFGLYLSGKSNTGCTVSFKAAEFCH